MVTNSVIIVIVAIVVLVAVIIALVFVLNQSPPRTPNDSGPGVGPADFTGPNSPNNANPSTPGVGTVQCPSALQKCGDGCIPTNAICCDNGAVNSYCLQPTAGCGSGNCPSCPPGQVFCGMFCQPKGKPCCLGGCPDNGTQPSETVVPSIKIESAKATLVNVLGGPYDQLDCIVELSGTATAPECSNVWIAWGDFGQPAQSFGIIECPDWDGYCTRLSHFSTAIDMPATTTWSVTAEYPFYRGEGSEFFAVLDTPKTPLNWKNSCAEAGLGNRTWDSIVLTCG